MDLEKAHELVKKRIAGPRYDHTVRVKDTAISLARRYGADEEKTALAAILHDYAKLEPVERLKDILRSDKEADPMLIDHHPELWHAPVAACVAVRELGITDSDVLNAIRFHTTGRAGMSLLEKVIYLADYIEPGRHFPGVEEVRELAEQSLDQAVNRAAGNTIKHLIDKGAPVFPDTCNTYNDTL